MIPQRNDYANEEDWKKALIKEAARQQAESDRQQQDTTTATTFFESDSDQDRKEWADNRLGRKDEGNGKGDPQDLTEFLNKKTTPLINSKKKKSITVKNMIFRYKKNGQPPRVSSKSITRIQNGFIF